MNPRVKNVKPAANYTLLLTFENGEEKIFDVKPFLNTGVFKALKDEKIFNAVRPCLGSITWPENIDLDPDRLYTDSVPTRSVAAEPKGGYGKKKK